MTNYLALKLFQGNRQALPSDKVEWQDKLLSICTDLVKGKKVNGVLPDFKGFDKKVYGSNHFRPRYEVALDRQPISFKLPSEINIKGVKDWSHKVRIAFNKFLASVEKVSQQVKQTVVTTESLPLPLTVGQTKAYAEFLKNQADFDIVDMTCWNFPGWNQESNAKEVKEWMFKGDHEFVGYVNQDRIKNADKAWLERVLPNVMKAAQKNTENACRFLSNWQIEPNDDDLEMLQNYNFEFVKNIAQIKFYIIMGKELGIDLKEYFWKVDAADVHMEAQYLGLA